MWPHRVQGSILSLLFILLSVIYLVIELSFNARVLDVSAGVSPDMDLGPLELYGRTISAAGATLLAWRLMLPYARNVNWSRLLLRLFLIAVVVFPIMFIGQKKLVDDLVDRSSADTRRSAEILSLLKYGIASGFVEIEELAIDDLTLHTAEGKMFITLSGLLAYNSAPMRELLEQKLEQIASHAISTQQNDKTEALFRNYRYAQQQVLDEYQAYLEIAGELEQGQASAAHESARLYVKAMNQGLSNWQRYRAMLDNHPDINRVGDEVVEALALRLRESQRYLKNCASQECVEDGLGRLEILLSKIIGSYTMATRWCDMKRRYNSIECSQSEREIRQRVVQHRYDQIAHQAGLDRAYPSRMDYLLSHDFRSAVFAALRAYGIRVDESWSFAQHAQMRSDIALQLQAGYLQAFNRSIEKRFGHGVQPRTELDEFNRIAAMQSIYRRALDALDVSRDGAPVPVGLEREAFEQRYVTPGFLPRFNLLYSRLKSGPEWYADDAPYSQFGKSSLRSLVIPVVAIAFSLVFGLLNIVSFLLSLIFLIVEENRYLRWLGLAGFVALVVYLPKREPYVIYSQQAYKDLYAATWQQYGEAAIVVDWLARAEPQLYPLASLLRQRVLNGFEFD